jgi:hypothetical protein
MLIHDVHEAATESVDVRTLDESNGADVWRAGVAVGGRRGGTDHHDARGDKAGGPGQMVELEGTAAA